MVELKVIPGQPPPPDIWSPDYVMHNGSPPCWLNAAEWERGEAYRAALEHQQARRERLAKGFCPPRKENAMRKDLETAIASLTALLPHVDKLAEFTSLQDAIAAEGKRYDDLSAKNSALQSATDALRAQHDDFVASREAIRKRLGVG